MTTTDPTPAPRENVSLESHTTATRSTLGGVAAAAFAQEGEGR